MMRDGGYRGLGLGGLILALSLQGCNASAPQGQIIATVNGEDVTTHDLDRLEAQLPAGVKPDKSVRDSLLTGLIDTRLAVQEARREGLAKTPEYLDAARAAEDGILSDLLTRHVLQGIQPPNPDEVDRYLTANAQRFATRELMRLDQVRFVNSSPAIARISGVTTLDQAEAALKSANIPYQRSVVAVDTLALNPDGAASLTQLAPGRLLGDRQGAVASLSAVVERTPKPLSGPDARNAAVNLIERDRARDAVLAQRQQLRQQAKVQYQQGYGSAPRSTG